MVKIKQLKFKVESKHLFEVSELIHITVSKGFSYFPGQKTGMTVSYTLDGEYPIKRKNRINSAGQNYQPSSVSRTESHSFELYISTYVTQAIEMALFGGYTLSRFEKNNPFGGANLALSLKDKVKLGFEYSHTMDSADRGESVNRFQGRIRYLFD